MLGNVRGFLPLLASFTVILSKPILWVIGAVTVCRVTFLLVLNSNAFRTGETHR